MSPPVLHSPPPPSRFWVLPLLAVLLLVTAVPVAAALGVWSCLRTSSDVTALRQAAVRASGIRWERQVEFKIGGALLGLARFGLGFAPLDQDARLALRTVRGAEVGVFQSPGGSRSPDRVAVLNAVDQTMTRRGWDRMVGVLQPENVVAVYVPRDSRGEILRACVLVLNEENLVVASARADLDAILELVERQQKTWGPLVALRQ